MSQEKSKRDSSPEIEAISGHAPSVSPFHGLVPVPLPNRKEADETLESDSLELSTSDMRPVEDDFLDVPPPPTDSAIDAFAEFEGELESESTQIDDRSVLAEESTDILRHAPARPILIVEEGKHLHDEFSLQEGENSVGRGIENDVILTDLSVSRSHLTITLHNRKLTLRDLGSGNGTFLNDRPVAKAPLSDGDRIRLGETTFVLQLPHSFLHDEIAPIPVISKPSAEELTAENDVTPMALQVSAGPVHPPHPYSTPYIPEVTPSGAQISNHTGRTSQSMSGAVVLSRPAFTGLLVAAGCILVLLGAAIALLIVRHETPAAPRAITLASERSPLERGIAAYDARRWDEAEGAFREASQMQENDPRAAQYLRRVRTARTHARLLDETRRAIASSELEQAAQYVAGIPADSPLHSDAQRLVREIERRRADAQLGGTEEAVQNPSATEARPRDNQRPNLPRAVSQRDTNAPGENAPSETRTTSEPNRSPNSSRPTRQANESPARSRRPRRRGPRRVARPSAGANPFPAIVSDYLAGNFRQATRRARTQATRHEGDLAQRLDRIAQRIEAFGQLYPRIEAANFSASVRSDMERALQLDRQIARSPQYRSRLSRALVDLYLAQARRDAGQPQAACSSARRAFLLDASNGQVRRWVSDCEQQARRLLSETNSASDARAREIYRSIRMMLPASNPIARQAREQSRNRARDRSRDEDE